MRSIPTIYTQLLQQKNNQPALSGLNSASQVSIWNLWLWITAAGQNLFEQLCDLFTATIENNIAEATVYTPAWIVSMLKQFQYASSPIQVRTLLTAPPFTISYPTVIPSLQIITNAAVVAVSNRSLLIKASTSSGALTTPQYDALLSDMNTWMIPGTQFTLQSSSPDLIYIQAQVYYNAAYSAVIGTNMDATLTAFFATLPFNGTFEISQMEAAMLAVAGVQDVVLNNVWIQTAAENAIHPPPSWGNGTYLVQSNAIINRNWQPYAGNVAEIETSGYNWDDSITYIAV